MFSLIGNCLSKQVFTSLSSVCSYKYLNDDLTPFLLKLFAKNSCWMCNLWYTKLWSREIDEHLSSSFSSILSFVSEVSQLTINTIALSMKTFIMPINLALQEYSEKRSSSYQVVILSVNLFCLDDVCLDTKCLKLWYSYYSVSSYPMENRLRDLSFKE